MFLHSTAQNSSDNLTSFTAEVIITAQILAIVIGVKNAMCHVNKVACYDEYEIEV